MSLKQPPSSRPPLALVRNARIQADALRIGDSILGMTGTFSTVSNVRDKGQDKLEVSTDAGENMVLARSQMVAIQQ